MRADIVILGGGIVGCSIAHHVAGSGQAGRVVVIERDPTYEFAATPRANGGIRLLFSLPENIAMARYGRDFYAGFAETMALDGGPVDIGFRRQGYLFLSDQGGRRRWRRTTASRSPMAWRRNCSIRPACRRCSRPWRSTISTSPCTRRTMPGSIPTPR
jgi:glycine/D-amino acid oxidase-like deaminating enzyme